MRHMENAMLALMFVFAASNFGSAQEPCGRCAKSTCDTPCFPKCGCCDDYCPHPLPCACWPPYPCYFKCAPAGGRTETAKCGTEKDGWALWFMPTPRTVKEAICGGKP
jgi:hypothetical protein